MSSLIRIKKSFTIKFIIFSIKFRITKAGPETGTTGPFSPTIKKLKQDAYTENKYLNHFCI